MTDELNGDKRLTAYDRVRYLWSNFRNNIRLCPSAIKSSRYLSNRLDTTPQTASPGRALTEAFLRSTLPQRLAPRSVRILDIGCGSGRMSEVLAAAGYSGSYTGIDIEDRFVSDQGLSDRLQRHFILGDVHGLPETEKFDLIISSSALEHIPNDRQLFQKLARLIAQDGLQMHILPGAWGLPLYLWHGLRQYTLCSLNTRVEAAQTHVYKMGGMASFVLHFLLITIGEMILKLPVRKVFPSVYGALLDGALYVDRAVPFGGPFLAVCVFNPKGENAPRPPS